MVSYPVYKIIHLVGVMMVFLALGGVTMHAINRGGREHLWRKPVAITHGIGLLLTLVGGFGLLARIGVVHGSLPGWAVAKLGIWIIFAISVGVIIRQKSLAKPIWIITLILGGIAAYLAGNKPF
jgi:hypothetical protein